MMLLSSVSVSTSVRRFFPSCGVSSLQKSFVRLSACRSRSSLVVVPAIRRRRSFCSWWPPQQHYHCFSTTSHGEDNTDLQGTIIYPGGQPPSKLPSKRRRRHKEQQQQQPRQKSWNPSYRFVDTCRLRVEGGRGGRGSGSMEKTPRKKRRKPDGGNGGMGGSVVVVVDPQCQSLLQNNNVHHVTAAPGTNGASRSCHGAAGKNTLLRVPPGVVVRRVLDWEEQYDEQTGLVWNENENDDENAHEDVPSYWWEDDYVEDEEEADDARGVHMDENSDDEEGSFRNEFQRAAFVGTKGHRHNRHPAAVEAEEQFEEVKDDADYEKEREERERLPYGGRTVVTLADLDTPGAHVVVARGGRGGLGTEEGSTHVSLS